MTNQKTMQQLAQEVLDVQNASNLCGVAQAFARAMSDLQRLLASSSQVASHPITRLWIDKMESLAGMAQQGLGTEYSEVYGLARRDAEETAVA